MPAHQSEWTAEMARTLPDDGKRYEVLDGELVVSPSPSRAHQRAVGLLFLLLHPYCARHGLGEALLSPADIEFSNQDLLQPDVFVVPNTSPSWQEATSLLLAIEVLSPTTARIDRREKRPTYQRYRVPECWLVDLDGQVFERWRPDDPRPEILADLMTWQPRTDIPALTINLPEYFKAANG